MKTKLEIVENWLTRYTGCELNSFGKYIILTNFGQYLDFFCTTYKTKIINKRVPMPFATADGITIINFGMGSANAATIMDLLSAILPKAVLLLVTDQPMISSGIKTVASDKKVNRNFVKEQLIIGVASLQELKKNGISVKHMRFD